jgi:hypothetical protein
MPKRVVLIEAERWGSHRHLSLCLACAVRAASTAVDSTISYGASTASPEWVNFGSGAVVNHLLSYVHTAVSAVLPRASSGRTRLDVSRYPLVTACYLTVHCPVWWLPATAVWVLGEGVRLNE